MRKQQEKLNNNGYPVSKGENRTYEIDIEARSH